MIEIEATDSTVVNNESAVITTNTELGVDDSQSLAAEIMPSSYVLTSMGIFRGNLDGSLPTWLLSAVQEVLTTGDGNLNQVLLDLQLLVSTLETGVNQNITNINSTNLSLAALETSVVSRLNTNEAAILNIDTTKVTSTEAQAIALTAVQSSFGNNIDAYIGSIASTYVDANSAIASDVSLLAASVDDVNASVSQISVASVDEGEARAKHSLVVNADGQIAGFVAEAGSTSEFTINADIFKVEATSQIAASQNPFTVNATTGVITLNGTVEFTNILNVPALGATTSRQASTVLPIDPSVGDLWYQTDLNNKAVFYDGVSWVSITQDAAQAVNDNTTTITGSKITTGTIEAAQIAAGTITADKMTANTLTANEIAANTLTASEISANTITSNEMSTNVLLVGGKVESSDYSWNAGAPIGFGMWSAGEADSGQLYNIVGGKIFGGAVEGTSLKGVTLDIQDINIKDTAGTTVAASFQGTGAFTYDSGTYTLTMTTGIRTSGNAPFNLLANNGYLSLSHNVLHSLVAPIQAGYTWLCSTDASSLAVRVYYGTGSTYRSLTLNSLTADEVVYGWTFKVVKDLTYSKDYHYYIKNNNVPEDVVTDVDGFVITLDSTGVMDTPMGTNTSVPFQWLVSNI